MAELARWAHHVVLASNRLRLPGPAVLPAAGAVVGLYSGLLAGIFSNLIALVSAGVMALSQFARGGSLLERLGAEMSRAGWHLELILLAGLPAAGALLLARSMSPVGPARLARRRIRVLSLLVLGALALEYPLIGLSALNRALQGASAEPEHLGALPWWATVLVPAAGGLLVGRLLSGRPELHGHGIPEVQRAVREDGAGLGVRAGLLKLLASAATIGTGGSAGREGPIVYGGGAVAAGVARTLGFTRRELTILLASGAGAGIAASFNAPIAGALFAMEIILRDFDLKVLSPILLASVIATLISRSASDAVTLLQRYPYHLVSAWELVSYVALGLLCGLLAYVFVRLLHQVEDLFAGRSRARLSAFLSRRPLPIRAATGGLLVGALAVANPSVWGTGHHFTNLAAGGKLAVGFLIAACALKLVATALTIGSGGSGGTFFPATVIGAMAGGAFGTVLHHLFPSATGPGGAYALVGMGGAVAGLTRGPLTGMMMIYELTGTYQIVLPLMVACTISSALCHWLVSRHPNPGASTQDVLSRTLVRDLMVQLPAVPEHQALREAVDSVVASGETALPVLDARGEVSGLLQLHEVHEVWRDASLTNMLRAVDVVRRTAVLRAEEDLHAALAAMDREDIDVLPVLDGRARPPAIGMITRAAIRRRLQAGAASQHAAGATPVAPTEANGRRGTA
ncbi:MAG TPA: chloride channel protein [Myxococcaceae bacterium]|jgi:CIC family chloride channel protein